MTCDQFFSKLYHFIGGPGKRPADHWSCDCMGHCWPIPWRAARSVGALKRLPSATPFRRGSAHQTTAKKKCRCGSIGFSTLPGPQDPHLSRRFPGPIEPRFSITRLPAQHRGKRAKRVPPAYFRRGSISPARGAQVRLKVRLKTTRLLAKKSQTCRSLTRPFVSRT